MWTSDLDAELIRLRKRGLSFGEISAEMGITRGAALGRFRRLKGKVFLSQVAREQEIADAIRRRKAARLEKQQRLVKKLKADIAAGKDRNRDCTRHWTVGRAGSADHRRDGREKVVDEFQQEISLTPRRGGSVLHSLACANLANQM